MADVQLLKEKGLATIDAAHTILSIYDYLDGRLNSDVSLMSFNKQYDPISYLIDIFKHTEGYDALLETISKFLVFGVEPLELAVKTLIITHLKDFFSCSANPFITDDVLRDGICFQMSNLDLTNMFDVCPLDEKIGKYFYYGIQKDGSIIPDDLYKSQDFNALLWYMRNRSVGRQVWYGSKRQKENADKIIQSPSGDKKRLSKKDGIITLEYFEYYRKMLNAEGHQCSFQVPCCDTIHVMIGNTMPKSPNAHFQKSIVAINAEIQTTNERLKSLENERDKIYQDFKNLDENVGLFGESGSDAYNAEYNLLVQKRETNANAINAVEKELDDEARRKSIIERQYQTSLDNAVYRPITENHYYRAPLIQFNTDLVMSMNLFDSKVIAAQILENLTGRISFDFNLSYTRRIIQEEIKRMVIDIVESDETVVSDCFFSFSNEDYDMMLRKAELNRAGVYDGNGALVSNATVDAASLLNMLNNMSDDATEEERLSTFKTMFETYAYETSIIQEGREPGLKLSMKLNIIENLLTQLVSAICMSIVSPKIYMVMAINLKIMGQSVDFSLRDFIQMYRQLLVNLIRMVRNAILQFFVDYIREKLEELAAQLAIKLTDEAVMYYMKLLEACMICYRLLKSGTNDWTVGDVRADIVGETSDTPKNANC